MGIHYLVSDEFNLSIKNLYQFLFLPLKVIGSFIIPLYFHNLFRKKILVKDKEKNETIIQWTDSSVQDLYRWDLHVFGFKTIFISLYWIFWDLFGITTSFFYCLLNLLFLGYPIWRKNMVIGGIFKSIFRIYLVVVQMIIFIPLCIFQFSLIILPFFYPIRSIVSRVDLLGPFCWIGELHVEFSTIWLIPHQYVLNMYPMLWRYSILVLRYIFHPEGRFSMLIFYNAWIIYFTFGYSYYLLKSNDSFLIF
jgi:hypothetical protein